MRALRWHARGDVRIDEVDELQIERPDDAILSVEACGICGSDLEEVDDGPLIVPVDAPHPLTRRHAPITLGHEIVGRVIEVGPEAGIAVGTRVSPTPVIWCGSCEPCLTGDIGRCTTIGVVGLSADGGLAERIRVSAAQCIPVDNGLPAWKAALIESYAVAIHATDFVDVTGKDVAIVGFGSVGSCLADVAISRGASGVVAIDTHSDARSRADAQGIDRSVHPDDAADIEASIVFEASGAIRGVATAVEAASPGATIVLVGIRSGDVPLPLKPVIYGELTLVGSVGHNLATMTAAARELGEGHLGNHVPRPRIVSLDDALHFFDLRASNRPDGKVVAYPNGPETGHNSEHDVAARARNNTRETTERR